MSPLGQAAPILGLLPNYAIQDILPIQAKKQNVTGSVTYSGITTQYTSAQLLGLNATEQADHFSALAYVQAGLFKDWLDLGFGLDSSLIATVGWDNATGYGVPNGLLFVDAARQFARGHL